MEVDKKLVLRRKGLHRSSIKLKRKKMNYFHTQLTEIKQRIGEAKNNSFRKKEILNTVKKNKLKFSTLNKSADRLGTVNTTHPYQSNL